MRVFWNLTHCGWLGGYLYLPNDVVFQWKVILQKPILEFNYEVRF